MRFSTSTTPTDSTAFWLALLLLAVGVYVFGLGGQYVPTNGDELVYAHIARKTAESGHWLPLASELVDTRNTKPPMLFWQAMVAGDWGARWTLTALRAPSLIYLLLVSGTIVLCLRTITHRWQDGLRAACVFLAFLSTFRYGRPYLTSAPETFWFSLPLFVLLWQRTHRPDARPGWLAHGLLGLALGVGLAYKSFALIAPAAAAWWLALVSSEPHLDWRTVRRHTLGVGVSAALAVGVFALWFVLDPAPEEIWREFIVAENARKFSDARGWWHEAFALSGSSLWSQLLAYPVNGGLLFFTVVGLGWLGLKQLPRLWARWPRPSHESILLAWALVWLLVFLFPSQRSARYVIPAMPAVAMLLALHWRAIARAWFLPTLLLSIGVLLLLSRIAWVGHALGLFATPELTLTLLAAGAGLVVVAAGLIRPAWTRGAAVLSTLLVYACFHFTTAPLDGPIGRYDAQTIAAAPTGRIAVPNGFNSQFERFQFMLPGPHDFTPYETGARRTTDAPAPAEELHQLLASHDAVVWVQPTQDTVTPPCVPHCRVLGQRWLMTSRHLPGEVRVDNLWWPQEWLFRREWLLTRAKP